MSNKEKMELYGWKRVSNIINVIIVVFVIIVFIFVIIKELLVLLKN